MNPTTYVYKEIDNLKIEVDVYRPALEGARPVVIYIHGGALILGSRTADNEVLRRRVLDAGYIYVTIDYRLAPETKIAAIAEDVCDAVRWIRAEGPSLFQADAGRIAVSGGSAGGALALLVGQLLRPPVQALVSLYGYGDMSEKWISEDESRAPEPDLEISEQEAYAAVSGPPIAWSEPFEPARCAYFSYVRARGDWGSAIAGLKPGESLDRMLAYCPLRNLTPDFPATLLIHGEADSLVPAEQSILMARGLDRLGVDNELLLVQHAEHAFDFLPAPDKYDLNAVFEQILDFLKRRLV